MSIVRYLLCAINNNCKNAYYTFKKLIYIPIAFIFPWFLPTTYVFIFRVQTHSSLAEKKIFCNILKVKNNFLNKGADHCMVSRISNLKNIYFLKQIDFCSFAVFFRPNKTRSDSFKQLWKFWIRDFEVHGS